MTQPPTAGQVHVDVDTPPTGTEVEERPASHADVRGGTAGRLGRRRRTITVTAVLLFVVGGVLGWWWASTPQLVGSGGLALVASDDHLVVHVESLAGETAHVLPTDRDGTARVVFEVTNRGRFPIEIVAVCPDEPGMCQWAPERVVLRDDPRLMYSSVEPGRPAVGATVAAGGSASLWMHGSYAGPPDCLHQGGVTSTSAIPIDVRAAGRTSRVEVDLGFVLGWSDEPVAATSDSA